MRERKRDVYSSLVCNSHRILCSRSLIDDKNEIEKFWNEMNWRRTDTSSSSFAGIEIRRIKSRKTHLHERVRRKERLREKKWHIAIKKTWECQVDKARKGI